MKTRFRGFLPVVVDVETGGVNPSTDPILEIAVITIKYNEDGILVIDKKKYHHVFPFFGANLDEEALKFTGIDPYHPFRYPIAEHEAVTKVVNFVNDALEDQKCKKAVLVGHNSWFDLHFLNAAFKRNNITKSPFHSFTSLDTASLSALIYKQTVLPKALRAAKISYNVHKAHSALYDALKTAELFCKIVNDYDKR